MKVYETMKTRQKILFSLLGILAVGLVVTPVASFRQPETAVGNAALLARIAQDRRWDTRVEIQTLIAELHPPTLEGMIASLEPIPTLEELLAPSWHNPSTPCRRTLTGSRKNHVDRLEKTIMGLGQHGDDIEAGALREEVLQAVTA